MLFYVMFKNSVFFGDFLVYVRILADNAVHMCGPVGDLLLLLQLTLKCNLYTIQSSHVKGAIQCTSSPSNPHALIQKESSAFTLKKFHYPPKKLFSSHPYFGLA